MSNPNRADLVAAWGIGVGVGLIALQVTWLIANRIATLIWGIPVGPTVGIILAVVVGVAVSIVMGRRFAERAGESQRLSAPRGSAETAIEKAAI